MFEIMTNTICNFQQVHSCFQISYFILTAKTGDLVFERYVMLQIPEELKPASVEVLSNKL